MLFASMIFYLSYHISWPSEALPEIDSKCTPLKSTKKLKMTLFAHFSLYEYPFGPFIF